MKERLSSIEHALALAQSGTVSSLTELRASLRREGYGNEATAVTGKGLKMQLVNLIARAKPVHFTDLFDRSKAENAQADKGAPDKGDLNNTIGGHE